MMGFLKIYRTINQWRSGFRQKSRLATSTAQRGRSPSQRREGAEWLSIDETLGSERNPLPGLRARPLPQAGEVSTHRTWLPSPPAPLPIDEGKHHLPSSTGRGEPDLNCVDTDAQSDGDESTPASSLFSALPFFAAGTEPWLAPKRLMLGFDPSNMGLLAWLDWRPHVALPVWLALVAIMSVAWIVYAYQSRNRLSPSRRRMTLFWMLFAAVIPLVLLLNPVWVEALPPPDGRPLVTMVIDTSASMNVSDDDGSETRIERAIELANEVTDSLDSIYETRWVTFDEFARRGGPMEVGADVEVGKRSDLAGALTSAVDGDRARGQAVVLLSDGAHNVGSSDRAVAAAKAGRGRGVSVFPVTVARPMEVKNLSVHSGNSMRMGFVEQPVVLSATVRSRGLPTASVRVDLTRDDEVIQTQTLMMERDQSLDVDFNIQPEGVGLFRYEVRVEDLVGEASSLDNKGSLSVRVLDAPIGVLLLEGKPYWDSKFLARNLSADPSIRLESLVMLKSDRFLHRVQSTPVIEPESAASESETEESQQESAGSWQIVPDPTSVLGRSESLRRYQIIVLGRDAEAYLDETTLARLRDWVAVDGGSIVCARGAPQSTLSAKLGRMLPVRWTDAVERRTRVNLTPGSDDEGWLAVTSDSDPLTSMPSLITASLPQTRGGLPRVLASGTDGEESIPIVSYQPFGAGRTVVVEGAGMWRWALLPPDYAAADRTYGRLWNGLLQWLVSRVALAPGQDRTLQADQLKFSSEEVATATLLVRASVSTAEQPKVRLSHEDSAETREVLCEPVGDAPGVYQVRFGQLAAGSYRAELVDAASSDRSVTAFEVRQPIGEALELNPNAKLLQAIASESGGKVLDSADADAIADAVNRQIVAGLPVETTQSPAWDRWWVLGCGMGLMTMGWIVRRRNGLI